MSEHTSEFVVRLDGRQAVYATTARNTIIILDDSIKPSDLLSLMPVERAVLAARLRALADMVELGCTS